MDDDSGGLDLLGLLEASLEPEPNALALNPALDLQRRHGEEGENQIVPVPVAASRDNKPRCSIPSMKGKVGSGRHGNVHERGLLTYHMRHAKMMKSNHDFRLEVADLLQDSCFVKSGKIQSVRAKATATGVVLSVTSTSKVGNRFKRVIPWDKFLRAAYGELLRSSHLAIALDVSQRSVKFMSTLVAQIFMNQQLVVLARLIAMASSVKPAVLVRQIKWDETQLLCSLNADKSEQRVQSTWQVMAVRQRILVVCPDGRTIVLRLVMPPVVLLSSGAHHI